MMSTDEIRHDFAAIEAPKDLLNLLNKVKRSVLGGKYHPFSFDQLFYYSNPRREDVVRYRSFTIPKKSGDTRTISSPVAGLKSILTTLNDIFQAIYRPSKQAMGFAAKRSVVTNAQIHVGQRYIFNTDLKDFFTSINRSRVWRRLTLKPFSLSDDIADIVAGLCTMRDRDANGMVRYVLPQGAPTSPIITNMICDRLDAKLARLAKRFGLRYSRYADDITFSSMHFVYGKGGRFISELHDIVTAEGFEINDTKTRLQHLGIRQEVTGLVVSERVNVSKEYARELKLLIHIWQRYGYLHALDSYTQKHQHTKGGIANLEAIIKGKLNYMRMVKGTNDAMVQRLQVAFNELKHDSIRLEHRFDSWLPTLTFNATYTRSEIEALEDISLKLRVDTTKVCAYLAINGNEYPVTISRHISSATRLELMHSESSSTVWRNHRISICSNEAGSFILLHKRLRRYKPKAEAETESYKVIDIDTFIAMLNATEQDFRLETLCLNAPF